MAQSISVKNKQINASRISRWIVQNECDAEDIVLTLTGCDDVSLNFFIVFRTEDGTSGVEPLEKEIKGTSVVLTWRPSRAFSSVEGETDIQLIGVDDPLYHAGEQTTIRWSTMHTTVTVSEDIETDQLAVGNGQTLLEGLLCESFGGQ